MPTCANLQPLPAAARRPSEHRERWAVALPPTASQLIGGRTGAGPLTRALGFRSPRETVELVLRRAMSAVTDGPA